MMHSSIAHRLRVWPLAFVVLVAIAMTSEVVKASESNGATARNKQIVIAAFDHWAAGGTTFFIDLLAPDVVWTIEGSGPNAGVHLGRDALLEHAVRPLASRLTDPIKPVSTRVWADGDHVIVNWEGVGRARDGQAYTNRYVWIMHMRDGKAAEVTAFLDLARFDDVLQRVPASPSR